ncbi:uncharacterized protein KY384_003258 [Bacidia gigantensis]|uniref:uncharacterized protein n=1 Tax=Bacidia gigantensis TaxID=2732470 RepID=UPI001D055B11|nr:uncharacterized protein KY384_003258 [Bacidia gigantensis]KAG8531627.1 hypothetical protein KY384_003258 [Bacidia gigantensis]
MNTIMSRGISHKSLMEAITLLYMLNEYPEFPKENQQSKILSVLSSIYQLPFQCEKQIVENLAFLSATTHDSAKVMAVCLEEARDRRSCTIRLTSNNGDIDDVMLGFKLMAKILEQGASRANSKDDDMKALFRCIVTLDFWRILSRLRSRHAKNTSRNKNKSVLIILLDTAIRDQSIRPSPNITVMELADVLKKIKTLKALFMKFEDFQDHSAASSVIQDVAMELIIQMHNLASQTKLRLALNSSKTLNAELKTSLPEAVEKLGRYYSISYELICVARSEEYSIFNSIAIKTSPTLRPSQPLNVDKNVHPLTALQNILRPGSAVQSRSLKPSLESCLGKPIQVILDEFRLAIADYYKSVKVHAEIQLLFFYELNSDRIRPRTICSSKSACYLCDLFFRLHGQYYVPRTHGRLYHRWTLPDWHTLLPEMRRRDFDVLLRNFSDILKVKVRVALDRGPVRANHPNETTTLRLTLTREQLPDRFIPDCPIFSEGPASLGFTSPDPILPESPPQAELLTGATSSSILPSTSTLGPPAQEPMTPRELPSGDTSINTPTASPFPPLSPSSTASPKLNHELTKGDHIRRPIPYPNISIDVGTTRLNLHLSSNTTLNPDILSNPSSRCLVRVKWLQGAETGDVNSQATNAEGLSYDTETEFHHGATCTPTELHLRRGEDFVSIKYTFDEPR